MKTNIIDALNWRYATKGFDSTKKVDEEVFNTLIEAARLAPSSFGLQPWKFIVVNNPEVRQKLRQAAWDQPQVTDASHIIVFAVNKKVDAAYVDTYIQAISETRGVPVDALKGFADMMKGSIASRGSVDAVTAWSARQVYIALGTLVTTAAFYEIDACPMEGFDPAQFDEILGLTTQGLSAVAMVAVGFRSSTDTTAAYKKVRFARKDVVIEVK